MLFNNNSRIFRDIAGNLLRPALIYKAPETANINAFSFFHGTFYYFKKGFHY